jgi:hypothetical protein
MWSVRHIIPIVLGAQWYLPDEAKPVRDGARESRRAADLLPIATAFDLPG